MIHKIKAYIKNNRGESSYIGTVVFILVTVVMLTIIIDVVSVVITKQKLDSASDQLTRQIQLAGKVDGDTDNMLDYLKTDMGKAGAVVMHIDTEYITKDGCATAIQLGTPFYLTLTADVKLGGFWELVGIPVTLRSSSAGVSERYWK